MGRLEALNPSFNNNLIAPKNLHGKSIYKSRYSLVDYPDDPLQSGPWRINKPKVS